MGKSEKRNEYPGEIERKAIRLFLEEGMPYKDILARFGEYSGVLTDVFSIAFP